MQLDVVVTSSPVDSVHKLKRTPEQIKKELKKHEIVPRLLDKAPNQTIYVSNCGSFNIQKS